MSISNLSPTAGRGVFAGKDYVAGEEIEHNPVMIKRKTNKFHQHLSYVYEDSDSDYHLFAFGTSMIYNGHHASVSTIHDWSSYDEKSQLKIPPWKIHQMQIILI